MTTEKERRVILNHVFEKEDNLEAALRVCFIFNSIKANLLDNFSKDLVNKCLELFESSGGKWHKIDTQYPSVLQQYYTIGFCKREWADLPFSLALSAQRKEAGDFIIGIYGRQEKIDTSKGQGLFERINQEYDKGNSSPYWWWYQYVEDEYTNWTNEDFLLNIIEEKAKKRIIDYLANELVILAEIASPEIEKMIKAGVIKAMTRNV